MGSGRRVLYRGVTAGAIVAAGVLEIEVGIARRIRGECRFADGLTFEGELVSITAGMIAGTCNSAITGPRFLSARFGMISLSG